MRRVEVDIRERVSGSLGGSEELFMQYVRAEDKSKGTGKGSPT